MEKKSKWPLIKRILGTVFIVMGIIFVAANYKACYNAHKSRAYSDPAAKLVKLQPNSTIKQVFTGRDGELKKVGICMDNMGAESAKGRLSVKIFDAKGKLLCEDSQPASMVLSRDFTWFRFLDRPETHMDEEYTAVFTCENFQNQQGFGVYTSGVYNRYALKPAVIDGVTQADGNNIRIRASFGYYDVILFTKMAAFMLFAILLIWLPYGRIEKYMKKKLNWSFDIQKFISRVVFFATPLITFVIMEILISHTISHTMGNIFTLKFWLNILIYSIILAIAYAITNRTQYATIITMTVAMLLGTANYFVVDFRGIPVLVQDLLSIGTAANVAGGYLYEPDMWMLWAVTMFAAIAGLMLGLKPYKGFTLKKRWIPVLIAVIGLVGGYYFFVGSDSVSKIGVEDSQWKPQLTYNRNGTALSFLISWKYIKTEKPKGYSVSAVEDIVKDFKSDKTSKDSAKKKKLPNIITIMNESLADFEYDGKLETTEDYMPFLRSMKKDTVRGHLYVSIEGANTANSEFEFLTGSSMAFFAPRAVPYNNLIKGIVPSLPRTLAAQGYAGCDAYHPYLRSGWNRPNVYASMGFKNFYSQEHYINAEYARNFISDKSNMEQIIKDFEASKKQSKDPFYMFNITVQNHGGYVGQRGRIDTKVKVKTSGLSTEENNQYMTLAKMSDDAFKILVDYFKKSDEPTIILMFGDHQPPLVEEFYETLFGKPQNEFTTEDTANWYSTPYIIWANYDIKEKDNENMSCNYLSSYLLKMIGADMTGFNKYLLNLKKKLPVMTALFYQGDDKVWHESDQVSNYTSLIQDYSKVQYNMLFDQKHRLDDFFFLEGGNYKIEPIQEIETTKAK